MNAIFLGIFFILATIFKFFGIDAPISYIYLLIGSVTVGFFYIGECINELKNK